MSSEKAAEQPFLWRGSERESEQRYFLCQCAGEREREAPSSAIMRHLDVTGHKGRVCRRTHTNIMQMCMSFSLINTYNGVLTPRPQWRVFAHIHVHWQFPHSTSVWQGINGLRAGFCVHSGQTSFSHTTKLQFHVLKWKQIQIITLLF